MKLNFYLKIFKAALLTAIGLIAGILLLPLLPTKEWLTTYTIVSGSMSPIIPAGSVVLVQKSKEVTLGNIVAFEEPTDLSTTIVHRIVDSKNENGVIKYITKGDNNNATDNWSLPSDKVLGKVLVSIPMIGYLQPAVRTPLGFVIILGLPLLFFAYKNILLIIQGFQEIRGKNKKSRGIKMIFLGFGFLTMASLIGQTQARALFSTTSTINNISLFALSVTPTPSTIPTPTPTPRGGMVIDISGNGAGSNNNVENDIENSTTVTQSNTTSIITQQSSTANTGGNVIH